jgi:hypothetical protein
VKVGGPRNLEMTYTQGFGDEVPAPQLNNDQVILDQDHSTPMDLDSDNDISSPTIQTEQKPQRQRKGANLAKPINQSFAENQLQTPHT